MKHQDLADYFYRKAVERLIEALDRRADFSRSIMQPGVMTIVDARTVALQNSHDEFVDRQKRRCETWRQRAYVASFLAA